MSETSERIKRIVNSVPVAVGSTPNTARTSPSIPAQAATAPSLRLASEAPSEPALPPHHVRVGQAQDGNFAWPAAAQLDLHGMGWVISALIPHQPADIGREDGDEGALRSQEKDGVRAPEGGDRGSELDPASHIKAK